MTAEERNKEIEWLMGSIQRSAIGGRSTTYMLLFLSIILIAFGLFMMFFFGGFNDDTGAPLLLLGGMLLFETLISYVSNKRIAHAETPRELLATHDRMLIIQSTIFMVIIAVMSVISPGGFVSKACLILSGVLLVITGWLAMQQRLRLWVGIILLIVESVLLYFSQVGLLVELSLLIAMLSIMRGEKSLFTSKESEGLDEEDQQDIKRLRELVKESESRIEMNTNTNNIE